MKIKTVTGSASRGTAQLVYRECEDQVADELLKTITPNTVELKSIPPNTVELMARGGLVPDLVLPYNRHLNK